MKGAAKCDNHCELQNSENQLTFECILRCWVIPGSMPASVSVFNIMSRQFDCPERFCVSEGSFCHIQFSVLAPKLHVAIQIG